MLSASSASYLPLKVHDLSVLTVKSGTIANNALREGLPHLQYGKISVECDQTSSSLQQPSTNTVSFYIQTLPHSMSPSNANAKVMPGPNIVASTSVQRDNVDLKL